MANPDLPVVDMMGGMHHYLPGINDNLILAYCQIKDTFVSTHGNEDGLFDYMYQLIDDILASRLQPNDQRIQAISQFNQMQLKEVHDGLTQTFLTERETKSVGDIRDTLHRMYDAEEKILRDYGLIIDNENPTN